MALPTPEPLAISLLVRWLLGWWLCLPMPALPDLTPSGQPRVSVLIPARNEALSRPRLLEALAQQSLRPLEVIVIDDHSSVVAASHAAAAGVTVLASEPLPPGWCGKTWALQQGATASSGDLLVFLDADTEPNSCFLARLVANQQQQGGFV
jgi:4,4'-diaponeurosporenoate glycosyltransferase